MRMVFQGALTIPALLLVTMALATQPPGLPASDESQAPSRTSDRFGNMRSHDDDHANQQVRLRDAVSRAFDARQAAQRAEVERLRRELAEIETAIQERERLRQRIIDGRMRELLQMHTTRQTPMSSRIGGGAMPGDTVDSTRVSDRAGAGSGGGAMPGDTVDSDIYGGGMPGPRGTADSNIGGPGMGMGEPGMPRGTADSNIYGPGGGELGGGDPRYEPRIAPNFGGEQSERQREASKSQVGRAVKELEGT